MAATAPSLEVLQMQEQIAELREENKQLWKAIEMMQGDMAYQGKRIKALEGQPKESKKAQSHIDKIYEYLTTSGQKGLTYANMAEVLNVSKRRAKQLRPAIEADGRFVIIRHPVKTNSHVICLKKVRF